MNELTLTHGHDHAWDQLAAAVRDRNHGFHTFTLATVDSDGLPQARTMVLRNVDRANCSLQFNTDVRSLKVAELRHHPSVCALFYSAADKLQVRVQAKATLHAGDAVSAATWQKMQRMSRDCYRTPYAPSSSRANTDTYPIPLAEADGYENLVVCDLSIFVLEWLSLSSAGHARARHEYINKGIISSQWLYP